MGHIDPRVTPAFTQREEVVVRSPESVAVNIFLDNARVDMNERMTEGLRRGWGNGFQNDYSDDEVIRRVDAAVRDLKAALNRFREDPPSVGIDEVRKRAADLANQAFMAADPVRLENN